VNEMCDVVIIGAGQAGLSTSHELSRMNREHIILEQGRTGQTCGAAGTVSALCFQLDDQLAGAPYGAPIRMDSWLETRLWSICVVTPHPSVPRARGSRGAITPAGARWPVPAEDVDWVTSPHAASSLPRVVSEATPSGGASEFPSSLTVIDCDGYTNPTSSA